MTSLRSTVARLFGEMVAETEGVPPADFVLAPRSAEDAARVLDMASEHRLTVLPWGGGTHQGFGDRFQPDVVLVTTAMNSSVEWQPDDLTVVVEAGVTVARLEEVLAERGQSAVLAEVPGAGTVGGAVAAGISGWRRLRYGPTRDRVLEVVLATGDGRVVRGGARVVKNVTGYDLPRLAVGSLGSLGVVTQVCLKLWPRGQAEATVTVPDPEQALAAAYRPLAVLEADGATRVYLAGSEAEVLAQAEALGAEPEMGLHWPEPVANPVRVSVRVPPASIVEAVSRLPSPARYVAAHGVGEISAGFTAADPEGLSRLREWAEARGGAVVLTAGPEGLYEEFVPWGSPPPTFEVQRRIKAAFDPVGVMVPGRLPGGV